MATATLKIDIWTEKRGKFPSDDSDLAELLAPHIGHVQECCEQGYQSGQIVDERFAGWWKIERDADALQKAAPALLVAASDMMALADTLLTACVGSPVLAVLADKGISQTAIARIHAAGAAIAAAQGEG